MTEPRAILLVQCPDRPGLVAAISSFLFRHGANILDFDQHTSEAGGPMKLAPPSPPLAPGQAATPAPALAEAGGRGAATEPSVYFTRLEFSIGGIDQPLADLEKAFEFDVARPYQMSWRLTLSAKKKRMAVLVSKHDHALLELLWAWKRGELRADVSTVISNHPDLGEAVTALGVPFVHVPNSSAQRAEAEARMAEVIGDADLVVLARYMQIVSPAFVARWPERMINIHHSFLPAFIGADPYRQAYERGVKVVGATAHYVTAELDAGPIIEQDVARVTHRDSVDALKQLGRDLERRVLARAVRWHCEDRVLVHGNKTVVFS
jgi:formyltetrahydrofolate deformylase